jgi:hypothetical protein
VQQLEEQRFLLDQDVQNYIQQANAVSVPRLPLTICEDAPKSYQADLGSLSKILSWQMPPESVAMNGTPSGV